MIRETDHDSMTNAHKYLENASMWLDAAAVTLDTTAKYTFNKHPRVVEIEKLSKSIARLDVKLIKLLEELKARV